MLLNGYMNRFVQKLKIRPGINNLISNAIPWFNVLTIPINRDRLRLATFQQRREGIEGCVRVETGY